MHILVVHRIHLFAEALAQHLRRAPGVAHVGTAYGADQCVLELRSHRYDIVVLTRAGMERCVRLRRSLGRDELPRPKIVVAGSWSSPGLVAEAARARMDAVVWLNQPVETLAAELADVVAGTRGVDTSESLTGLLSVSDRATTVTIDCRDESDIQIVRLVAAGLCDKDIASRVFLSSQTVRNRVSRILRDSGLENRTQLATVYLRREIHTLLA